MTRQKAPLRGDHLARAVTYPQGGPMPVHHGEAVPIRPTVIRTHRLTLTGELGHDTAPSLEAAIDLLCDSGIDELVLDLGGLTGIDATGVQVIAMRCELCSKRGVRVLLEQVDAAVQQGLAAAIGPAGADALMRML